MIKKDDICSHGLVDYFERENPGKPLRPVDTREVDLCRQFIKENLKPHGKGWSSYHFKHAVERYYNYYIANGSFIMAALLEGIDMERLGLGPNMLIKLTYKTKAIMQQCNGQGGHS